MLDYVGLLSAGNEEMVRTDDRSRCPPVADVSRHDSRGRPLLNGSKEKETRKKEKRRRRKCFASSQVLNKVLGGFSSSSNPSLLRL